MANYAGDHARTLKRAIAKGSDVSFSVIDGGGSYDPTGGWTDNPVAAIDGYAVELPGDPEEYAAMELIGSDPVTLFFVPVTFGATPARGQVATWAGKTRTVQRVYPVRPAGVTIAARVVLT